MSSHVTILSFTIMRKKKQATEQIKKYFHKMVESKILIVSSGWNENDTKNKRKLLYGPVSPT